MLKNFKCKKCGSCCRTPRLYKADVERIKKLGYKEEDFVYTDNFGNTYPKEKKGWCMFLDKPLRGKTRTNKCKTAECKIYSARPKICRQYPSELIDGDCKPVELAFDKFLEKKSNP